MQNRATPILHDADQSRGSGVRPDARLGWLFVVMLAPLLVVAARLSLLQNPALAVQLAAAYDQPTISTEPIPGRDGRILSADGRVLAFDEQRFEIQMHYRWLEEPADEAWLRKQAASRLKRDERRRDARIKDSKRDVLAGRARMWSRLAELTAAESDLSDDRRRVQDRVERIVGRVERRRKQRSGERDDASLLPAETSNQSWHRAAWRSVVRTLSSPPRRDDDPVVVREELEYHTVVEDVGLDVAAEIESHPERFPGLRVVVSTRRRYPQGSLAAHIVGLRRLIDDEELATRKTRFTSGDPLDYRPGDRIGRTGAERSAERHLRGLRGERKLTRDQRGEILSTEETRRPRVGRDVVLTINATLQERVEFLLDESIPSGGSANDAATGAAPAAGGCIIALDAHTGAILAAASAPRFDLEVAAAPTGEQWQALSSDPGRPFFDRALKMTIAPGSVFKTLTAVALMESGRFDPDARVHCQGYLDRPDRHRCYVYRHFGVGHGDLDLTDALARSCNVYFFQAARDVGPQQIVNWADRFEFGRPTGVDLPGERGGRVPRPPRRGVRTVGSDDAEERWYPGDTLGLAIGQSRLAVTPLQIARMMAAVANGGNLVTPHVVMRVAPPPGGEEAASSWFPEHPPRPIPGLREGTLARVREGLEKVVSHPRGTGYKRVRIDEVAIAGKTGTAEVGGGKGDHAWFAGYTPADQPRFAFVVVLEHAGSGGAAAGPVARKLVEEMLELGLVQPKQGATKPN